MENNIRTMKFVCEDDWGRLVYRCQETGILYKGESFGDEDEPIELYSCGNSIDGEPCYPISKDLDIHFIKREAHPTEAEKFNYQMLSRLKMDCDYYLGYGNRSTNRLWAGDEKGQIEEMKKIYNSFTEDKKPQWLTWEDILQYEKEMVSVA